MIFRGHNKKRIKDNSVSYCFILIRTFIDVINNIYANSVFYPNPTRSIFTIRSLNNNAIGNIIIYNLLGDIVYEHNCLDTEVQIDVLYLPTGIYTIYMQGFRSKLIKEN